MVKQNGGTYMAGASIAPGVLEWRGGTPGTPDCLAVARPGMVTYSGSQGLPGLSGGRRRRGSRKQSGGRRRGSRKQNGGRRRNTRKQTGGRRRNTRKQTGGRYGFVDGAYQAIPLERSTSDIPQNGGASDNQAYYAPTGGYSNQASTWVGSTGAPLLLSAGYSDRSVNQACVKTGGSRRVRKSKKSRKVNRR
jgi:hypothetical protein